MGWISPYATLGAYLVERGVAGDTRVTLTFAALEATILGRALPVTARSPGKYRPWWLAAGSQAQAWDGWLSVGWRVAAIDLAAERVTFARAGAATGQDGG